VRREDEAQRLGYAAGADDILYLARDVQELSMLARLYAQLSDHDHSL
jgi:hypothetical protein